LCVGIIFTLHTDAPGFWKHSFSWYMLMEYSETWTSVPLTFRTRASYPLGRHLNFSEIAQALASYMLGQPQPRPFKRFALNIFTEISLVLSTTLEVFPASCSDWFPLERKSHVPIFLYEAVCTEPVYIVAMVYG
jgi:hypothetical protein